MAATYRHDYEAFDRLVLCAPWMVADMLRRAENVKAFAETHAPYDPNDKDGTHYRDSFSVEAGIREGKTRRAYGRVTNTDWPTCLFVEYGFAGGVDKDGNEYGPQERHRTLGNALEAAKE